MQVHYSHLSSHLSLSITKNNDSEKSSNNVPAHIIKYVNSTLLYSTANKQTTVFSSLKQINSLEIIIIVLL